MNPAWPVCLLALLLDAGMVAQQPLPLPALLALHVLACMVFAVAFARGLSPGYAAAGHDGVIVAFVVSMFLPVLGLVGLLVLVAPALCHPRSQVNALPWSHPRGPQLPATAVPLRPHSVIAGSRNLGAILCNAPHASTRTAALMASLSLPDAQAAALWRKALRDPQEEIRLLAYALLNRKEKVIESRIHAQRNVLNAPGHGHGFQQHKAMAYDYWELAHLNSAQGGAPCPSAALTVFARDHAWAALTLEPKDSGLQFLLGRALLCERKLDEAQVAFQNAVRVGLDPCKTLPYLAEIALLRRRYADVKRLRQPPGSAGRHSRLEGVWRYWEGASHGTNSA